MPSHYLCDTATEDLGLILEEGQPILPRIRVQRERQPWAGRVSGIASPRGVHEGNVRRFKWTGRATTVAARNAVMESLLDFLTGATELRDRDTPTRVTRGTVSVFDPSIYAPSFVNVEPSVAVEIETPGFAWDVSSQSRVLSTTPVAIPCGTLPHGGRIYLTGASAGALSTEVRIRYRGISGALLGEMVLMPSLASGEYAVIDLDTTEIVKVSTANAITPVEDWLTGGDFFKLYPRDGNRPADVWATLEVTNGAALYTFRRNWKE